MPGMAGSGQYRELAAPYVAGPEGVIPGLSGEELAAVLDALYGNPDTPEPHLGAELWYEACHEESTRREPVASPKTERAGRPL